MEVSKNLMPTISLSGHSKDKYILDLGNYEIQKEDGVFYAVRKTSIFPKSYEECCKILSETAEYDYKLYKPGSIFCLQKLLICRDTYWKLAGDWEPDWTDNTTNKYIIHCFGNEITKDVAFKAQKNSILAFPNEEIRDIFYNNFKSLIEECKDLL